MQANSVAWALVRDFYEVSLSHYKTIMPHWWVLKSIHPPQTYNQSRVGFHSSGTVDI